MITTLLFGVHALDAGAYVGVLVLAIPFVILAAMVPALRASRVDPMTALREP